MDAVRTFFEGLALMAGATLLFGWVRRLEFRYCGKNVLMGLVFGACAWISMLSPIVIAPGVLSDGRNIFIAFAALYLTPRGAAAALVVAALARLGLGGSGAALGVVAMIISTGIGLLWRHLSQDLRPSLPRFALQGGSVALSAPLVFLLPVDPMLATLTIGATLAFDVVAGSLFGAILHREIQLAEREQALMSQVRRDPLTGLLNRRGLEEGYARLRPETAAGAALILMDLDHFKSINDRFGHPAGDAVLRAAAETIVGAVRQGDTVARIGGEEFAVLVSRTSEYEAFWIADRVRRAVGRRAGQDIGHHVTASAGVVYLPVLPPLEVALREADARLYRAKARGRNCTVGPVEGPRGEISPGTAAR